MQHATGHRVEVVLEALCFLLITFFHQVLMAQPRDHVSIHADPVHRPVASLQT